ncbi:MULTISPECIES: acyl carrier protein [Micromonospora]|uniref:Acyl carrier protein (ACP) n=1 Tax=Micromonospora lupini str. Lupac 08 TaxID=1150864 RepID=I0L8N0_9ACTN|nr:phosphopantetheine-binding protein [Micromonospora lupini]MCX5066309.1 phosphopantetheine-binding protein [Micromonospora lupini]CCH20177.1 Acyl carrier protein (ACP) [Micromonospora lupini str. Lupac 08]
MAEVVTRMAALLARVLEDPALAQEVTADTNLLLDLGIDSLHMITFLLAVEEEFDVEIDFESLDSIHLESVKAFCHFALDGDGR